MASVAVRRALTSLSQELMGQSLPNFVCSISRVRKQKIVNFITPSPPKGWSNDRLWYSCFIPSFSFSNFCRQLPFTKISFYVFLKNDFLTIYVFLLSVNFCICALVPIISPVVIFCSKSWWGETRNLMKKILYKQNNYEFAIFFLYCYIDRNK